MFQQEFIFRLTLKYVLGLKAILVIVSVLSRFIPGFSSGLCSHPREVKLHVPDGTSDFYWLLSQTRGPCPLMSVVVTYTSSILCFFLFFFLPKDVSCLDQVFVEDSRGSLAVLQTIKSVLLWQPWDLFSQERTAEVFVCIFMFFPRALRTPCVFCSSAVSVPFSSLCILGCTNLNIVRTPSRVRLQHEVDRNDNYYFHFFFYY